MLEMDPRRPRFHKVDDPNRETLGENPNAIFYAANLDSAKSYLVRGRIIAEDYFSMSVKNAPCTGCFLENTIAVIDDRQLTMGQSYRNFEVFLSAQSPPPYFQGDWISLADAPEGLPLQLITQHYYEHRASMPQVHRLSITLADPASALALPNPRAAIPSDADMARKLRALKTVIQQHTQARDQSLTPPSGRLSSQVKAQEHTLGFKSITSGGKESGDIKYWSATVQLKPVSNNDGYGGGGGGGNSDATW